MAGNGEFEFIKDNNTKSGYCVGGFPLLFRPRTCLSIMAVLFEAVFRSLGLERYRIGSPGRRLRHRESRWRVLQNKGIPVGHGDRIITLGEASRPVTMLSLKLGRGAL